MKSIGIMLIIILTLAGCHHCPPCTLCNTCYAATPPYAINLYNFSAAQMDSIHIREYSQAYLMPPSVLDSLVVHGDSIPGSAGYTISVSGDHFWNEVNLAGESNYVVINFPADTLNYIISGCIINPTSCIECSGQAAQPLNTLQSYFLNGTRMNGPQINMYR